MREKILKIINKYGYSHQLKKLSEEIFEFQEAVIEYMILKEICSEEYKSKLMNHIEEEYADVVVMMEQFNAYYNLDNNNIIDIMNMKINRQIDRMKKEMTSKLENVEW